MNGQKNIKLLHHVNTNSTSLINPDFTSFIAPRPHYNHFCFTIYICNRLIIFNNQSLTTLIQQKILYATAALCLT